VRVFIVVRDSFDCRCTGAQRQQPDANTTSAAPQPKRTVVYKRYVNPRFKYGIDYPAFLIAGRESDNGDGRKFKSRDGQTELTVYGMSAYATIDGNRLTVTKALQEELQTRDQNAEYVSYQAKGKNWFVLSGIGANKIFYVKWMIDGDNVKVFELRYSDQQKERYDPIVSRVAASFKNTQ
jgi:hypothetical protein